MPRVKIGPALPDRKTLDVEIARLRDLDVGELRSRWHTVFGRRAPSPAPPPAVSRSGLPASGRSAGRPGWREPAPARSFGVSRGRRTARRGPGRRLPNSGRAPCWAANGTARCNGWRCWPMALPGTARPIRACRRSPSRSPAPAGTDRSSSACGTSHRRSRQS